MKRPSFQFYPGDWRRDSALQSCSLTARGMWIEAMCIMHECEPYGILSINGAPMTEAQIARLVGESQSVVRRLLEELERAGVFGRNEHGAIYSRRMLRDEYVRSVRSEGGKLGADFGVLGREFGKLGGRPRGDKKPPLHDAEEPPIEPPPSSSSSSSSSNQEQEPKGSLSAAACPQTQIIALYHELLPELPPAREWPEANASQLRARWRSSPERQSLDWWRKFFGYVRESDFLMGRKTDFQASLMWLVKAANFAKVVNGNYENRGNA